MPLSSPSSAFTVEDFGLADYPEIWQLQKQRVAERLAGSIGDTVLLGEHPPVITGGRGSHAENLLNPTIAVVSVERGGDVTYHGPGQLIAYPILHLPEGKRDLHQYLRNLEEAIILTLADFDVTGERNPGWTGVWVREPASQELKKIASIGVAVKQWVTYHGLALNVCTDLSAFEEINPCGLNSQIMTTLQAVHPTTVRVEDVKPVLIKHLADVFS